MATQPATKIDAAEADAAAEKAYAAASGDVSPKLAAAASESAKADAPKVDKAVVDVKAAAKAPKKARAVKAAARKVAPKKKIVAKAKPGAKPVARKIVKAPAPNRVSNLKDKIMATTKTADFTETLKQTAAEAQTRAKAAYDRVQAYNGEMTELTKGNVEALVEAGKILGNGVQAMARGEFEAAKAAFETVTADLKAVAAVKSPTDLFKLQGEIARRNFDALVAHYSKNAEASLKLANDAFAPLSSRMSLAAERLSKAA